MVVLNLYADFIQLRTHYDGKEKEEEEEVEEEETVWCNEISSIESSNEKTGANEWTVATASSTEC